MAFDPFGALLGGGMGIAGSLFGGGDEGYPFSVSRAQNNIGFGRDVSAIGPMFQNFKGFADGLDLGGLPGYQTYTDPMGRERARMPLGGQEYQRLLALSEVMRGSKGLEGLRDKFSDQMAGFARDNTFDPNDAQTRMNSNRAGLDLGLEEASNAIRRGMGDESADVAAIESASEKQIRDKSRQLAASLRARGLSGSSDLEADVATNILPEVESGRLSAIASARNMARNRAMQGGGMLGSIASGRANFAQGQDQDYMDRRYNPALALGGFDRMMQLERAPIDFRAGALAQPGSIYNNPTTKFNVVGGVQPSGGLGTGGRISGMLGDLGGDLLYRALGL